MKYLVVLLLALPAICSAQTIVTIAGGGTGTSDGIPATDAAFGGAIRGFAIDHSGDLFIADWWGNRLRRVDAVTGHITTIAGTGTGGYNGDSIPATNAQVYGPAFVATDTFGNIYFSESQNQRVRVIHPDGYIYTYAGNGAGAGFTGSSGLFSGDGGPATAASFDGPEGLTINAAGDLYISDANNHRVRLVDAATHSIHTIAGDGSASGAGSGVMATAAGLAYVYDITVNEYGQLYIADIGDGAKKVRLYDPASQMIYDRAGTGTSLYNGDGMESDSANINPYSMVHSNNILFISDYGNNRIRAVQGEFSIISTFAGNGFAGFSGDGGPATAAEIFEPAHLAADTCGSIYFADASNLRIRKIAFDTACHFGLTRLPNPEQAPLPGLSPNPATDYVNITGIQPGDILYLYNMQGIRLQTVVSDATTMQLSLRGLQPGFYLARTPKRVLIFKKIQ